jgi:hypothetical protein
MNKIVKLSAIPEKSHILNRFGEVHYCDSYQVYKKTEKSAEEIAREIMKLPGWALALLKLRNAIVGVFGLKTDPKNEAEKTFFTVIENNDNEIVMGEIDRHLDFRLSIMKDKSEGAVSLTTVVHFNNMWGRVYFFPVKPFHKIIIRTLLKKYLKN